MVIMNDEVKQTEVVEAPVDRFAGRDFQIITEDTVIPTAEELTAQLIKEEAEKPVSPQDLAAAAYSHYYPIFIQAVDTLTSASLKRILKGMLAIKAEQDPAYQGDVEVEMVNMARYLIDARGTIILQYQIEEMRKAQAASTEAAQNIQTSFSTTEEDNKEI